VAIPIHMLFASPPSCQGPSLRTLSLNVFTALAIRVQEEIPKLNDDDQTSFVHSRCIADNFIYALDLVQC
jgi:hypothetical protein